MGNCLRSPTSDDISLLHEEHGALNSRGEPPPPYQEDPPYSYYIQSQRAPHLLSEEQQIRLAQRLGLIQHLPVGKYDETKKKRECAICMVDFEFGDEIRFLPCMHIYHKECIDDWLIRSFTCPSCMEPVDAALLSSYETGD
ncbi:RING finger protein 11-like [Xenia sp. Carnegie-2017]|uniref:RING finger protein 11-like n=1 Tax=Xenia sp. Carnegie-2017 TaxID=2897299 RepID=UPI001F04CD9B|nr:RING finger protein 11-like [Xenia sp. Carnegie-2017]